MFCRTLSGTGGNAGSYSCGREDGGAVFTVPPSFIREKNMYPLPSDAESGERRYRNAFCQPLHDCER